MWITSGWHWTRAQPSNEQQLECTGLENDRETGRCLTNGIPVDSARSGDYFDHLDEHRLHPDFVGITQPRLSGGKDDCSNDTQSPSCSAVAADFGGSAERGAERGSHATQ